MRKILVALVSIGILSYLTVSSFSSQGKKLGRNRFEPGTVTKLTAGDNIQLSPTSGIGNVTITSTGTANLTASNTNYVNLSGSTQTKAGGFVLMGSMTVQGTGINLLNGEFVGNGAKLNNTLSLYDEGTFQGRISSVNCVGGNIGCTASDQTGTLTITGGSGGGGISTFTFTRQAGGDILIGTSPFNAIPGMSFRTGKSTWNVTFVNAFTHNVSTVQSSFFKIARTTGPDQRSTSLYSYLTPDIEVSTGVAIGSYTATSLILFSTETYAIHVTSIPEKGQLPSEFGMSLQFWVGDGTQR